PMSFSVARISPGKGPIEAFRYACLNSTQADETHCLSREVSMCVASPATGRSYIALPVHPLSETLAPAHTPHELTDRGRGRPAAHGTCADRLGTRHRHR